VKTNAIISSCAGSIFVMGLCVSCTLPGHLVSISISPATASAQTSKDGEVQFVATGTYSDGRVVTPLAVIWGFHAPWVEIPDPVGISIDLKSGLAQCSGYTGTKDILAIAPIDPSVPLNTMSVGTPIVSATAHLTCE
jgi:hypothetical protein